MTKFRIYRHSEIKFNIITPEYIVRTFIALANNISEELFCQRSDVAHIAFLRCDEFSVHVPEKWP